MIAVLDYGIGNLRSAQKALARVGADARLVTTPGEADAAAGVVLPGVGAFGRSMEALRASGLDKVALAAIGDGTPFLGICVGLQMLYEGSEEDPGVAGLGVLAGRVVALPAGEKRPQMQWNQLRTVRGGCPLLAKLGDNPWLYFVHSYAPEITDAVVGVCDYGGPVAALVDTGRVWATQFHPEKSGERGLQLLANFVAACGGG